jgi:hypothetical protein
MHHPRSFLTRPDRRDTGHHVPYSCRRGCRGDPHAHHDPGVVHDRLDGLDPGVVHDRLVVHDGLDPGVVHGGLDPGVVHDLGADAARDPNVGHDCRGAHRDCLDPT